MIKLLIVDDEKSVRYAFQRTFGDQYDVITAENGEEGVNAVAASSPTVILMDIRMPKMNGLTALKHIHSRYPHVPVIMMTAYADSATAMQAMQEGAFDYVVKPFDNEELRLVLQKALASVKMQETLQCEFEVSEQMEDEGDRIVGASPSLIEVCKKIGMVASAQLPVLVTGETGVGKELVARAIYQNSGHHQRTLMVVNCASLPNELVESELFGYESGAFTGAVKQRVGRFEQCDGGTIFLDEIGELSLQAQAKILRVVQQGTFERLGGNRQLLTDVRIIAATNKNLAAMVRDGAFRGDLLHRINVFNINIPPLRARLDDLPLLVKYFISRYGHHVSPPVRGITGEAITFLAEYHWPGNIRQLENVIRRATVLAKAAYIGKDDCIIEDAAPTEDVFALAVTRQVEKLIARGESRPYHQLLTEMETVMIGKALALSQGNQVHAADLLGINRMTLRKKISLLKK